MPSTGRTVSITVTAVTVTVIADPSCCVLLHERTKIALVFFYFAEVELDHQLLKLQNEKFLDFKCGCIKFISSILGD